MQKSIQISQHDQSKFTLIQSDDDDDQTFLHQQNHLIHEEKVQVQLLTNQQIVEGKKLSKRIHKPLQLIYIIAYSVYRKSLQQIAQKFNCQIFFIKNSYLISCQDNQNAQGFEQCSFLIEQQVGKIIFIKFQFQKKYILLQSPTYNKDANQKGIYFTVFNRQILIHTNKFNQNQLQQEKKKIIRNYNIYPVRFIKKKKLDSNDYQVVKHYKTILNQHYKERFQENNLKVQINLSNNSIFITASPGTKAYIMMEAKNTIKMMIQGLTGIALKNFVLTPKQQKTFQKYLQKVSKYPITCGRTSQHVILILSKDNIIRQLLKKKQQLIKRGGIIGQTQIGLYIPPCYSIQDKKVKIFKICKQLNYDSRLLWAIRYFRPMICTKGQQKDPGHTLQLLIKIILGFIEVKQKFQSLKKKSEPNKKIDLIKKKQLEQQNKYAYQVKNSNKDSKQMQKILKRDVLQDQIFMKKRYNVIYSLLQGQQYGPFFIPRKSYDKGIQKGQIKLLTENQLQKSEYLMTYFKTVSSQIDSSKQNIEVLFQIELKNLKQLAQNQNETQLKIDKNRKIAHMIKKLIIVL